MVFRLNPQPSELHETLQLLKDSNILITYHGTTQEQANKILREGFKTPNLFEILLEAYRVTGLTREVRKSLPIWALEYITSAEIIPRLVREHYTTISFAPHGVASRWAGWGGEVLHETVREINLVLGFMKSQFHPKTEAVFEEYLQTVNIRDFYINLGQPVVLKAWVKYPDKRSKRIQREIKNLLEEFPLEEAWHYWNFTYRDDKIRDPSQVLKVEIADPPFTGF